MMNKDNNIINKYKIEGLSVHFENTEEYPVVGVLIPCYNHGKYIKTAIDSVYTQDYPNKLIIIIDDCSTDNSVEIIEELIYQKDEEYINCDGDKILKGKVIYPAENKHKIYYINTIFIKLHKNQKQAHARNVGIATTYDICDYYCQLDADDEYLPDKISKCIDVALQDPKHIGLVYHDVIIKNKINNTIIPEYREPYSYERLVQECIVCNTALINKNMISHMPYENISPVEDWGLWLDIAYEHMCVHIPEFLSIYNVVDSSCTFTVDKEVWNAGWAKIREKLEKRHGINA